MKKLWKREMAAVLATALAVSAGVPNAGIANAAEDFTENDVMCYQTAAVNEAAGTTQTVVAKIGQTEYTDLVEAAAKLTAGETLQLQSDVTVTMGTVVVSVDGAAVIDLNGHTITGTGKKIGKGVLTVSEGTVTVTDSADKITVTGETPHEEYAGKILLSETAGTTNSYGILVQTNGKAILKNLQITADSSYNSVSAVNSTGTLEMENVDIKSKLTGVMCSGESKLTSVKIDAAKYGVYSTGGVTTLKDVQISNAKEGVAAQGGAEVVVTDCQFDHVVRGFYVSSGEETMITVNSGNYNLTGSIAAINGNMKIKNGTFNTTTTADAIVVNSGNMKIWAGEFNAAEANSAVKNIAGGNLVIYGGYYKTDGTVLLGDATYKNGYKMSRNVLTGEHAGYYGLIPADTEETVETVAVIDETEYSSIASALEEMTAADTLILQKDTALTRKVKVLGGKIDLNGHKLTTSGIGDAITAVGTVTVKDSKEGGSIESDSTIFDVEGHLRINSGDVLVKGEFTDEAKTQVSGATAVKLTADSAKFTLNGGSVKASAETILNDKNKCTITVNGGIVEALLGFNAISDTGNGGTINVTGGTVKTNPSKKSDSAISVCSDTVKISGGNIIGHEYGLYISSDENVKNGNITISSGELSAAKAAVCGDRTITITGGYFKGVIDCYYTLKNGYRLCEITDEADPYYGYRSVQVLSETNQWDYVLGIYDTEGNLIGGMEDEQVKFLGKYIKDNVTVKLEKDFTANSNNYLTFTGENITFDLNGHTYNYTESVNIASIFSGSGVIKDSKGGGEFKSKAYLMMHTGNWEIQSGKFSSDCQWGALMAAGTDSVISITGGTFDLTKIDGYFNGGKINVAGGTWNINPSNFVVRGYKAAKSDDTYIVQEDLNAEEERIGHPVTSVCAETPVTADVVIHETGEAYLYLGLSNVSGSRYVTEIGEVKEAEGNTLTYETVKDTLDETEVISYVSIPLTEIYQGSKIVLNAKVKADAAEEAANAAYTINLDWADYAGPGTEYTNYMVSTNFTGTAMSDYDYDEDAQMTLYDDEHAYFLLDFDNFVKHYASSLVYMLSVNSVVDEEGNAVKFFHNTTKTIDQDGIKDTAIRSVIFPVEKDKTYKVNVTLFVKAMGFTVSHDITIKPQWPSATIQDVIAKAEKVQTENYTSGSVTALTTALTAAKEIAAKETATEEEIETAKTNLEASLKGLVEISGLKTAISEAEGLTEADYTEESFTAVKEALAAAKETVAKENATAEEVEKAQTVLSEAVKSLVTKPVEGGEESKFKAGTYTIDASLRKATDPTSVSMAGAVMKDKAEVVVDEKGNANVKLYFNEEATIMGIKAHPTGLELYGEDGTTKIDVKYTTVARTDLYNKETQENTMSGDVLTVAEFTLPYVAENGIYMGRVFSDYMESSVVLQLDLNSIPVTETGEDKNTIADGAYLVPITLLKANEDTESMGNGALNQTGKLVVKEGKANLYFSFTKMKFSGMEGYLSSLETLNNIEFNEYNYPTKYDKTAVDVLTTYDVVDDFNKADSTDENCAGKKYPKQMVLSVDTNENLIWTEVYVPIMGSMGVGRQVCRLKVDYDKVSTYTEPDVTALTKAIEEAEAYDLSIYTETTAEALGTALEAAKEIKDSGIALQEDVDGAVKNVTTAIEALEKKQQTETVEDGIYAVSAKMVKPDGSLSMSNNAIVSTAMVTVKDGTYRVSLNFMGLTIGDQKGYLSKLKYYETGYALNQAGNPTGTLKEVDVESYQKYSDGSLVKDELGTDYPDVVSFEVIPEALTDGIVPLQVFVPIMEAIQKGSGTQNVMLTLDWTTMAKTTAEDPVFTEGDKTAENPAVTGTPDENVTPAPTGTTAPTKAPTGTTAPTKAPTAMPTVTTAPTKVPTATTVPTKVPTLKPTAVPTKALPKKNEIVKYKGVSYKVTKSSKKAGTVSYVSPKSSSIKSVTIPDTIKVEGITYKVTSIEKNAFKNCKKLKSVTIGKNVTKIGSNAFSGCKNLKKITIKSSGLKTVGKNAIKGIHKKAVIKCPVSKVKSYKKLFKSKTGYQKTMKIAK